MSFCQVLNTYNCEKYPKNNVSHEPVITIVDFILEKYCILQVDVNKSGI